MSDAWLRWRGFLTTAMLLGSVSCSIPSLEDPKCADARDSVKRFYSLHFDRVNAGSDNAQSERQYLTDRLATERAAESAPTGDYFTTGETFPKAFRVGSCKLSNEQAADVSVLLLWRTEAKSDQREIRVKATFVKGAWLVDEVAPL